MSANIDTSEEHHESHTGIIETEGQARFSSALTINDAGGRGLVTHDTAFVIALATRRGHLLGSTPHPDDRIVNRSRVPPDLGQGGDSCRADAVTLGVASADAGLPTTAPALRRSEGMT